MFPFPFGDVANHPELTLVMKHPSLVPHRRSQPPISIMASDKQTKPLSHGPTIHGHIRQFSPREWRNSLGLIALIHTQGIVSGSSAEEIPVGKGLAHVFKRSRIHQKCLAVARQMNAQRVSVTVTGRSWTLRPCIDEKLLPGGGVCHQVKATLFECGRRFRRLRAPHFLKLRYARRTQQPKRLFTRIADQKLEIATLIKDGSRAQRVQQMLCPVAAWIKEPATVVVAHARHCTGSTEQAKSIEHLHQRRIKLSRDLDAIQRSQHTRVQKEVQGVDVIVG